MVSLLTLQYPTYAKNAILNVLFAVYLQQHAQNANLPVSYINQITNAWLNVLLVISMIWLLLQIITFVLPVWTDAIHAQVQLWMTALAVRVSPIYRVRFKYTSSIQLKQFVLRIALRSTMENWPISLVSLARMDAFPAEIITVLIAFRVKTTFRRHII